MPLGSFFRRSAKWPRRYLIGGLVLGVWVCAMVFLRWLVTELPDINTLESYTPPLITRIYDVHSEVIAELFTQRRTILALQEIPVNLQNAFLATEDEHFFTHWGVNLRGIARAALSNLRYGRVVAGGSTITQQLAKVLFFTQQKTLARKLRELLLALQLERNYSKEEIFQMYLNQIYFGHGAYGVEAAARTYFGKAVRDLTLSECAVLAGLPRSPKSYSPFDNPPMALRRRAWALSRMRRSGFISRQEEVEAVKDALVTQRVPMAPPAGAYFVEYLRQILEPKYGERAIYQGGLSIYATLDLRMERAAEEVMNKSLMDFDIEQAQERARQAAEARRLKKPPPVASTSTLKAQGSLVALDPRTGAIRVMAGGREFRESQFNRVTQAQRQPGSAFKPFVWGAAVDDAMTPATIVDDDRVAFYNDGVNWNLLESATDAFSIAQATAPFPPDQAWVPQNWDLKYFGPVTLRTGLAKSRNLVSVRLAQHMGPAAVVNFAAQCGIRSPLTPVLSIALGTEQVNLLELTNAYATFANGGIRSEPFGILRVEDQHGALLEERSPQRTVAFSAQTAYLMVDLLRAVVTEGTGYRAQELGRPAAGKTGTNQDLRDLWFVGFTPELAAGAWMGYDDFSSMGKRFTAASKVVPWWTQFMRKALADVPARQFSVPEGIVFAKIDAQTGYLALPSCPKVALQAFKKGTEPRDLCPIDHPAQPLPETETEE